MRRAWELGSPKYPSQAVVTVATSFPAYAQNPVGTAGAWEWEQVPQHRASLAFLPEQNIVPDSAPNGLGIPWTDQESSRMQTPVVFGKVQSC